jgi:hypothetical protein
MRRITTKAELIALTKELGIAADWHEPGEKGINAVVSGKSFDNAGFWPLEEATFTVLEKHVILSKDGKKIAAVNLATLFAWATGYEG